MCLGKHPPRHPAAREGKNFRKESSERLGEDRMEGGPEFLYFFAPSRTKGARQASVPPSGIKRPNAREGQVRKTNREKRERGHWRSRFACPQDQLTRTSRVATDQKQLTSGQGGKEKKKRDYEEEKCSGKWGQKKGRLLRGNPKRDRVAKK